MIALDTNIVIRYLTQDGGFQSDSATRLIETELSEQAPGFISLPVICEMLWVLGDAYELPRAELTKILSMLLEVRHLVIEAAGSVARAIELARADISDAIIHEVGKNHGCARTLTFDRKFARLEGVELLTQ